MRVQWAVEMAWSPDAELSGDVWRLGLLRRVAAGRGSTHGHAQPWLRELYRDWAREAMLGGDAYDLRSTPSSSGG